MAKVKDDGLIESTKTLLELTFAKDAMAYGVLFKREYAYAFEQDQAKLLLDVMVDNRPLFSISQSNKPIENVTLVI
jgi:hypothetical protein